MNVCTNCGGKLLITETRHVDDATIRLRKCRSCNTKYRTIEEEIYKEDYSKLYREWREKYEQLSGISEQNY